MFQAKQGKDKSKVSLRKSLQRFLVLYFCYFISLSCLNIGRNTPPCFDLDYSVLSASWNKSFCPPSSLLNSSTGPTHGLPIHGVEVFRIFKCCFTLLKTNTALESRKRLKILDIMTKVNATVPLSQQKS